MVGTYRRLNQLASYLSLDLVALKFFIVDHVSCAHTPFGKMNLILQLAHLGIILINCLDRVAKLIIEDTLSVF